MNPFYYIQELKDTLKTKLTEVSGKPERISAEQHYTEMINMLDVLDVEMRNAEYHYEVESVDTKITTFEELTVYQKELTDEVIIFQPIAIGEAELSAIDMGSLAHVLTELRDQGEIKQNILLLPPNINVFRAKLAKPATIEDYDDPLPFN